MTVEALVFDMREGIHYTIEDTTDPPRRRVRITEAGVKKWEEAQIRAIAVDKLRRWRGGI